MPARVYPEPFDKLRIDSAEGRMTYRGLDTRSIL